MQTKLNEVIATGGWPKDTGKCPDNPRQNGKHFWLTISYRVIDGQKTETCQCKHCGALIVDVPFMTCGSLMG